MIPVVIQVVNRLCGRLSKKAENAGRGPAFTRDPVSSRIRHGRTSGVRRLQRRVKAGPNTVQELRFKAPPDRRSGPARRAGSAAPESEVPAQRRARPGRPGLRRQPDGGAEQELAEAALNRRRRGRGPAPEPGRGFALSVPPSTRRTRQNR